MGDVLDRADLREPGGRNPGGEEMAVERLCFTFCEEQCDCGALDRINLFLSTLDA